jgi:hypothetical protein
MRWSAGALSGDVESHTAHRTTATREGRDQSQGLPAEGRAWFPRGELGGLLSGWAFGEERVNVRRLRISQTPSYSWLEEPAPCASTPRSNSGHCGSASLPSPLGRHQGGGLASSLSSGPSKRNRVVHPFLSPSSTLLPAYLLRSGVRCGTESRWDLNYDKSLLAHGSVPFLQQFPSLAERAAAW